MWGDVVGAVKIKSRNADDIISTLKTGGKTDARKLVSLMRKNSQVRRRVILSHMEQHALVLPYGCLTLLEWEFRSAKECCPCVVEALILFVRVPQEEKSKQHTITSPFKPFGHRTARTLRAAEAGGTRHSIFFKASYTSKLL